MSRIINVAAIQLDGSPAPTTTRLTRASQMVTQAAQAGAHLILLPELFNTGYQYTPENFTLAESLEGQTVTWLKQTAAQHQIHLAGSLMLLDGAEIYNALLLFAPDGRMWRYNKNYPCAWERGYFCEGDNITIAHTDLGDIGLLICWDTAHRHLWQQYAGKVDFMLISSCPPDLTNPTYHFPSGDTITLADMGFIGRQMKDMGRALFGDMVNQQAAWLGVPAAQTVASGHIRTPLPRSFWLWAFFVPLIPQLLRHLPQAHHMELSCDFVQGCKIVDAQGNVLHELMQAAGESFAFSEITLPDLKPTPNQSQPATLLPFISYFNSDWLIPFLMLSVYRQGARQVWGKHMAPVSRTTRRWQWVLGVMSTLSFLAGIWLGRKRFS